MGKLFPERMKISVRNGASLRGRSGIALITALVFMVILMLTAVWLVNQMSSHYKITTALKNYEKLFTLADGACARGINYLKNVTPLSSAWDPRQETEITDLPLSNYLVGDKFKTKIFAKGYNTRPLPGWMLNWQGYSSFYSRYYEIQGKAFEKNRKSSVSALIIKIIR